MTPQLKERICKAFERMPYRLKRNYSVITFDEVLPCFDLYVPSNSFSFYKVEDTVAFFKEHFIDVSFSCVFGRSVLREMTLTFTIEK